MRTRLAVIAASLAAFACTTRDAQKVVDASCFGSRVLSFQDVVAEVVIPAGEACSAGSFTVVFTRGSDTLATLTEDRVGTVGFLGTADVDADGRGEFFVATRSTDEEARGALYAYTDRGTAIERMVLTELDSAQRGGYVGGDRFGLGGADQLVRGFAKAGGDSAWFAYSHGQKQWKTIGRPAWLR